MSRFSFPSLVVGKKVTADKGSGTNGSLPYSRENSCRAKQLLWMDTEQPLRIRQMRFAEETYHDLAHGAGSSVSASFLSLPSDL